MAFPGTFRGLPQRYCRWWNNMTTFLHDCNFSDNTFPLFCLFNSRCSLISPYFISPSTS
jgi:hypothetical protein